MLNQILEDKISLAKTYFKEGWSTHVCLKKAGVTAEEKSIVRSRLTDEIMEYRKSLHNFSVRTGPKMNISKYNKLPDSEKQIIISNVQTHFIYLFFEKEMSSSLSRKTVSNKLSVAECIVRGALSTEYMENIIAKEKHIRFQLRYGIQNTV